MIDSARAATHSIDSSLGAKVRRWLIRESPERLLNFEMFAASMYMAPATMRRRLSKEGTSFRSIKTQFLKNLAIKYLKETRLSVVDIAFQLGFSEGSAFRRAFKRWTGSAPNAFRRHPQCLADESLSK